MICPNSKCKRELPDDALICCYCGKKVVKSARKPRTRANGTGTAIKRGNTWEARVIMRLYVDENGQTRKIQRSKGGFKTKTEALEYCAVLKTQVDTDQKKVPLLREYWQLYEKNELDSLSRDKAKAYCIAWNRLKPISETPVNALTVADLRKVVAESTSTYYTARDCKVVLSHLFKLAAADGFVSKDLPSFIKLPKLEESERQPFTELEQAALWKCYESGNRDAAIPLIMIYTGMMPGELTRLTVDMIDFESRQIRGVGLKTKIRKDSPVYFPPEIVPLLEDLSEGKTGKIIIGQKDKFYARYYGALEAAGVRHLQPYSCRHTTATALAINNNIAPETVRRLMRWSTTAMLQRYAHPDEAAMHEAIDTLTAQK